MDLKEIEKELRTIADFIRDKPKELTEISLLIKNLYEKAEKSRELYEPVLIKKKEFFEKEKEIILASKTNMENRILKLKDLEEDLMVKDILQREIQNYEMALLVFNEEINRIENRLK